MSASRRTPKLKAGQWSQQGITSTVNITDNMVTARVSHLSLFVVLGLVSYVLTRGELMRRIVAHWRAGTFTLLSSPVTRAELAGVLARPAIRQLATAPLDELVRGLGRFSEHVPGVLDLSGACRDPQDDKFLACAVEGRAHYMVSSDRDLLDMRRYRDVAIVNPGQFLLALELYLMEARALAARFGRDVLADIQATVPLEPETAARVAEALAMLSGGEKAGLGRETFAQQSNTQHAAGEER